MPADIGGQVLPNDILPDGHGDSECKLPPPCLSLVKHPPQGHVVVFHSGDSSQEAAPLRGEAELFPVKGKELHPVFFFNKVDMLRDSGLRDMQLPGRLCVVHMPAHCQKGIHPEIKHKNPSFPIHRLRAAPPPSALCQRRQSTGGNTVQKISIIVS